ncbi:Oidioi.mRNA.OKI2018_I69.chr1.g2897.t1.cds [Oikopleura dioica]|uniref:Oidioi.mRNA.OKI2018_I69.chr1.g2897.t1.cds n=1 Tax=Oikopleura dioica TaxID=34765 RepID=A0ABN7SWU5_OIKDI|nr:Oidioi.mRNA.OKI2018_I69.chr1.g2897.t1.cds [Oikopleura dioica]
MKFTALSIAFLQKAIADEFYYPDYSDYPLEGRNLQNTLSGRRTGTLDTRQIFHRKRLINSQVTAKSNGAAWYFHYHDYGCYCVAPSDPKKNRGKPVDAIDSACKRHNMCYQCAYSDFSDARRECNPKQMGYRYTITTNDDGNIKIECLNSPDTCAYATCMCDKALADELGNLAMKGTLASKDYRNYDPAKCSGPQAARLDPSPQGVFNDDAGAFDFENQVTFLSEPDTGADVPQQCCGVYPQRFPYKSSTHECCSAGEATEEIKPLGTC